MDLGLYIYNPQFTEMPDYLLMSDIGLLVRVPSVISEVASPVKFAEYLAGGVPVIAYPNIGDTQKMIDQNQVGIVIDPKDDAVTEKQIASFLNQLDNHNIIAIRCRAAATNHLSWENYLDLYFQVYTTLKKFIGTKR